jgi:hypothetical protein
MLCNNKKQQPIQQGGAYMPYVPLSLFRSPTSLPRKPSLQQPSSHKQGWAMDGRKLLEINGILIPSDADKIDKRGEFAEKPKV